MRTKNSIRNIIVAFSSFSIYTLMNFITRYYFIQYLSVEYLGTISLFSSIVSVLSLAELGIGTAITYNLYEPVALKNWGKINALMRLYRKIYILISFTILSIGLLIIPFLNYFADPKVINEFYVVYIIILLTTSVSYLFSYKKALIIANQKNYLASIIQNGAYFLMCLIQIATLVILRNIMLFLIVKLIFTLIENITISVIVSKMYPDLYKEKSTVLSQLELREIKDNVFSLLIHKVGVKLVLSTDNIIISKIVGIYWVGIASNYFLIIGALHTLTEQVLFSLTSAIGNLNISSTKEKVRELYYNILYVNASMFSILTLLLIYIVNDFISIWVGASYLLDNWTVIILSLNFFLVGIRKVNILFRNALGLFNQLRIFIVFEVIINIIASIILGKYFGIIGVILGTTICTLSTSFWVEPYVLFKYGIDANLKTYFKKILYYLVPLYISMIINYFVLQFIETVSIKFLIIKMLFIISIYIFVTVVMFRNLKEFKNVYRLLNMVIKRNNKINN